MTDIPDTRKKETAAEKNDIPGPPRKRSSGNKGEDAAGVNLAKYRLLFESIPLGITISDEAGNIIESNRTAEQLLGLQRNDPPGRWTEGGNRHIIRPDGTPMPADEYAGAIALRENRPVANIEMGFVKEDGNITWIEVTAAPIPLEGYGVVTAYSDITGRKRDEETLKESETRYLRLLNVLDEGIWSIDKDALTTFVNPRMAEMLGYGADEMLGRSLFSFMDEPAKKIAGENVRRRQRGIKEQHDFEFLKKDGTRMYASLRTAPITDRDGSYLGAIASVQDISERKAAEEVRRTFSEDLERRVIERTWDLKDSNQKLITEIDIRLDAEKQLTKTVGEKEVMLREVHHRVKNNLQIIISLLNLQSRYITDEKTRFAFMECQNRVRAMALVHEKLHQSKDLETIDLDNYLRFLGESMSRFSGMKGKGITLSLDIRNISLAIDTAVPIGLIINELISNSLKYAFVGRSAGTISVSVQRDDHTLTILFRDNGVGMPEDFDWRNATSLGLRLVVSLVEQLSGTIELDRSAGTAFTIVVQEKT